MGVSHFAESKVSVLCVITANEYTEFLLRIVPHKERSLGESLHLSDEKIAKFLVAHLPWDRLTHCISWLAFVALKMNNLVFWGSILAGAIISTGVGSHLPDTVHFGVACIKYTFEAAAAQLELHLQNHGLDRLAVLTNLYFHNPSAVQWYTRYTRDILQFTTHFGEEEAVALLEIAIQDTSFFNNM